MHYTWHFVFIIHLCVFTTNITHRTQYYSSPVPLFTISFWKLISLLIHLLFLYSLFVYLFISFSLFFMLMVYNVTSNSRNIIYHIISYHKVTSHIITSFECSAVQYSLALSSASLHFSVLNRIHLHFLICSYVCLFIHLFVSVSTIHNLNLYCNF